MNARGMLWLAMGIAAVAAGGARGAVPRPPLTSVAFHPNGRQIAAGSYREALLFDARGRIQGRLPGHAGTVNGVAYSPDGRLLAAVGGRPGQFGEVRLWDVRARKAVRTWRAHKDALYAVAFHPQGGILAVASYDRLLSLWEVPSGRKIRDLKDHTDSVYDCAFHPDGRLLASASGDRTVKVWEVATGRRLYTLSEPLAEQYALAYRPDGRQLAAGGADKMIRVWNVDDRGGELAQSTFAHDGPVLRLLYARSGEALLSSGQDRRVKIWDREGVAERKVLPEQPDWALGLAVSPNGRLVVVARYDGGVSLYRVSEGDRRPGADPDRDAGRSGGNQQ